MDYYLNKMEELNAEGIDFTPISDALLAKKYHLCKIVASYTKEEWIKNRINAIPKTPCLFWRLVNGEKVYIDMNIK